MASRRVSTQRTTRSAATTLIGAGLACAATLGGCGSSADQPAKAGATTGSTAVPGPPNIVGTWTGSYSFPLATADGAPQKIDSSETLIIEKQDGRLVWGEDQYVQDGKTIKIPVRGSFDTVDNEITITENGGFFRGRVTPEGTLRLRFTRTDDQFTSFEVTLTRS